MQEGISSGSTAEPALEHIENQRRAIGQVACAERVPTARGTHLAAELAYRGVVRQIREVNLGSHIPVAREAFRELLGKVSVRPTVSGKHLEAHARFGPVALLSAVGAERGWVGNSV